MRLNIAIHILTSGRFAIRAMSNIEARLKGVVVGVGAPPSLPLSPEGQVQRLLEEATSIQNLGKMYIWWMPWF
jgi:serine/threonine-protein kinase ATR